MKASRWIGSLAVIGMAAGAVWAVADRSPLGRQAEIATGYAARTVCACRHIGKRAMASCQGDLEPGMEIVRLDEDAGEGRVTATVPLLARRTARYAPGLGCTLDP